MSIFESLAGRAIWSGVAASIRSARGHAITITSPSPQETLSGVEITGVNKYFPIRGALKVLPKEHEIWLLVQDEATALVWPQGFFPVQFNHQLGTWMGKIKWERKKAGEDICRGGSAYIAGVFSLLPGGWQVERVQIRAAEACAGGMPESSFRAGVHSVESDHGDRISTPAHARDSRCPPCGIRGRDATRKQDHRRYRA
jgi:hypothetical protein